MARFDVYRFSSKATPLVLDVQSDVLEELASRVVIPLVAAKSAGKNTLTRLQPVLTIQGKDYVLMTTDIAALPRARMGSKVNNVEADYRDDITNALDFLFFGF